MTFEPFAVQCLTCGSRLRVTDPSIVGGIAACPKCQSMVQIERQEQPLGEPNQIRAGSSNVDSQAITEDAIDGRASESLADTPLNPQAGFSGDSPPPSEGSVDPGHDDSLLADADAWQSAKTRRTRQIALVATLSASTLLVAGLVFISFVRSFGQPSAATGESATQTDLAEEATEVQTETLADDPGTDQDPSLAPETGEADSDPTGPVTDRESGMIADSVPARETDPARETVPDSGSPETDPVIPDGLIPEGLIPEGLIPSSPLDGMADGNEDSKAQANPDAGTLADLPPGLAEFAPILLDDGPTARPTMQAPPTMDELQLEGAVKDTTDPLDLEDPEPLNLRSDLALELIFRSKGYPLTDMMLVISELTGVPIQVDWVSFDLAGVDIQAPVVPPDGRLSAREILDAVAGQVGGEVREEETLLILTLSEERFEQAHQQIMDFADFGPGQATASAVLDSFLADDEPADPDANNGDEEEPADQAVATKPSPLRQRQQLASLAAETLRRMRGVEPKVPDVAMARWSQVGTSLANDWNPLDATGTSLQSDTPIALAGWLRRIGQANQTVCLVNWYDALRRGATPKRLLLPHGAADAAAMFERSLSPLGLQVRQVDAGHWWVGNVATYDRLPMVLATEPLGNGGAAFIEQMDIIMAGADRSSYRIALDPVSGRALVLLPRFVMRQLPKVIARVASSELADR